MKFLVAAQVLIVIACVIFIGLALIVVNSLANGIGGLTTAFVKIVGQ